MGRFIFFSRPRLVASRAATPPASTTMEARTEVVVAFLPRPLLACTPTTRPEPSWMAPMTVTPS